MASPNAFPNAGADQVAVFDSNFFQLFPNARPLQAQVRENGRLMEHPLEKGQIITDYRIILPIEIELPMLVTAEFYRDTYQQIKRSFLNSDLLSVQTRADNYQNMVIAEMPHRETPDQFDVLTIYLRFKQVQIVFPTPDFSPADPSQSDTQNLGEQTSTTFPPPAAATQAQIQASFLNGG